jgi:hypothetical protein
MPAGSVDTSVGGARIIVGTLAIGEWQKQTPCSRDTHIHRARIVIVALDSGVIAQPKQRRDTKIICALIAIATVFRRVHTAELCGAGIIGAGRSIVTVHGAILATTQKAEVERAEISVVTTSRAVRARAGGIACVERAGLSVVACHQYVSAALPLHAGVRGARQTIVAIDGRVAAPSARAALILGARIAIVARNEIVSAARRRLAGVDGTRIEIIAVHCRIIAA